MNYLSLVQRLSREVGTSGSITTVVGLTGEPKRLADWIASAWVDIQIDRPDWYWLRSSATFATVDGQMEYDYSDVGITSRFGMWDKNSPRLYENSKADELPLLWADYPSFRAKYIIGPQITARPLEFTISPSMGLIFGYTPDGVYTVTVEYFKSPQNLLDDSDTPEMPEQFHMAIVYKAMMLYARYESAPEIYDDAAGNYRRIMNKLEMHQLPTIEAGGALA